MALRSVVIGTGWSGEGHCRALQTAGVEVVALCGRSPEHARAMGQKLGIQDVRFDWRQALVELHPDIVSIATPAAPHAEMVLFAAGHGCHIVCEKPLGLNGSEARAMLDVVKTAGVKHAVGATIRYAPAAVYARNLLAEGLIGEVKEMEAIHHFNTSPLLPYSWFHQLQLGGGALNVDFSAFLSLILFITGGTVQSVAGEGRRLIERAPLGEPIHDLREGLVPMDPDRARAGEWRVIDVDMGYTVMARLQMSKGHTASVLFQGSEMASGRFPNAISFYGDKGVLRLPGYFLPESVEYFDPAQKTWTEMSIPFEINNAFTCVEDPVQNAWCQLYKAFIADVRGEAYTEYPTFLEGCLVNVIVDLVRNNPIWTPVPE